MVVSPILINVNASMRNRSSFQDTTRKYTEKQDNSILKDYKDSHPTTPSSYGKDLTPLLCHQEVLQAKANRPCASPYHPMDLQTTAQLLPQSLPWKVCPLR